MQSGALIATTALVLTSLLASSPARGQQCFGSEVQKITASDGGVGARFGGDVDTDADLAVIGSPNAEPGGLDSGEVHLYRFDGISLWQEEQILTASDTSPEDRFGTAVSGNGSAVLIGSPFSDTATSDGGAAYVFRNSGTSWSQEAQLTAPDSVGGDRFGISVSVQGPVAVVGADLDNSSRGAAYVYRFDGTSWQFEQKLNALDAATNDFFGFSVDLDGDLGIIGALSGEATPFTNTGAAYVYRYDGSTSWNQEQRLVANDGSPGDQFGVTVSVEGTVAGVGAINGQNLQANSGSSYVFRFSGSTWSEEAELNASDEAPGDRFGCSIGVTSTTVVTGAPRNDDDAADSGAAYIFRFVASNWVQEQKLLASNAGDGDRYGVTLGVDGNVGVIGSSFNDAADANAGASYILRFDGTSWNEEQQIMASDASGGDRYGAAVAVADNAVISGAPFHDNPAADAGAAYIARFDGTSWAEEQKLTASDAAAGDRFGAAVSIHSNVALVGADMDNGSGSAYVYRLQGTTWQEEQKLAKTVPIAGDQFGLSVAIHNDVAVVGSLLDDAAALNGGAAYVYRFNGSSWVEEQVLTASDPAPNDLMGVTVAVRGDVIVVGALNGDDTPFTNTGAAYVFRYNGTSWDEEAKLIGSDSASGDHFGIAVSIDGDSAAIGARQDSDAGFDTGSAYVFRHQNGLWLEQLKWLASDKAPDSQFGKSLCISGNQVLVGAPRNDGVGTCSGSAYAMELPPAITLDANPSPVQGGSSFAFSICGGFPGLPSVLCLIRFDATPFIVTLGGLQFGAGGSWIFPATVDPGSIVIGHTLTFVAFGLNASGAIETTNEEAVVFFP